MIKKYSHILEVTALNYKQIIWLKFKITCCKLEIIV